MSGISHNPGKCDGCEKEVKHRICVNGVEDVIDGNYCVDCDQKHEDDSDESYIGELQSEIESLKKTIKDNDWISVEDKPIITDYKETPCENSEGLKGSRISYKFEDCFELIAAVETNSGWWIRHCVLVDGSGLHVVTDDDTEPSGWEPYQVSYWKPWVKPPFDKARVDKKESLNNEIK